MSPSRSPSSRQWKKKRTTTSSRPAIVADVPPARAFRTGGTAVVHLAGVVTCYVPRNGKADRLLRDPGPHPVGVARWPVGAVQAPGDHPARLDRLVRADGGAPPRDLDRAFPRCGRRGRPHGPLQRHHPPGPPDIRRLSFVVAAGGPRPPPASPHVSRDRPSGTGRRGGRVLLRPDRVVRVRGLQHAADGDLRGRPRRVVLRPVRLEPHGQAIGAEVRQARAW